MRNSSGAERLLSCSAAETPPAENPKGRPHSETTKAKLRQRSIERLRQQGRYGGHGADRIPCFIDPDFDEGF